MRAVNLIPLEERRGAGSASSSAPTYGLLGGLALLVVALAAWLVVSNQVSDRKARVTAIQTQAASAEAAVGRLKPYVDFAAMEQSRMQTVRQLASTRFSWDLALHDLARVMDPNVWLSSLTGTVSSGVALEGAGTDASGLRSALPNPALSMSGCATSNDEVVRFVSRLRVMTGVIRVSLSDAQQADTTSAGSGATPPGLPSSGAGASGAGGGGDCRFSKFDVVVFYQPMAGAGAGAISGRSTSTTATPSSSTPPASAAPPASSAPPASAPASTGATR